MRKRNELAEIAGPVMFEKELEKQAKPRDHTKPKMPNDEKKIGIEAQVLKTHLDTIKDSAEKASELIKRVARQAREDGVREAFEKLDKNFGKDGGPALVIIESHESGTTQVSGFETLNRLKELITKTDNQK